MGAVMFGGFNQALNSRELLPLLKARGVDFKLHRPKIAHMKLPA